MRRPWLNHQTLYVFALKISVDQLIEVFMFKKNGSLSLLTTVETTWRIFAKICK